MKKRILSLFVTICMALSFMPVISLPAHAAITAVKPTYGDGTAANPYKIATKGNLAWFRDNINSGAISNTSCADLTADIDLNNENWVPIGTSTYSFQGTLDGRNFTIYNFKMTSTNASLGFIHTLPQNGVVENLHIEGTISARYDAGGIVYLLYGGTVRNCSFSGSVSGGWNTAGIAAIAKNGIIEDCWSSGTFTCTTVEAQPGCGGIVGWEHDSSSLVIKRCYTESNISGGSGNQRGCILGYARTARSVTVSDCYGTAYPAGTTSNLSVIGPTRNGSYTVTRSFVYTGQSSFGSEYNAGNGWEYSSGMKYPILRQHADLKDENKRTITIYGDQTTDINLPDYFNLILSKDKKYNQKGCFDFSITENASVEKTVFDSETYLPVEETFTLASASATDSDALELDGAVGVGTYNITVHAVDTSEERTNKYEEFDIPFTIVVRERVPEPQVLSESFEYSRMIELGMIKLTEGWEWSDPSICPKDTNTTGYEAYYQYDADAEYYDYSAVTAAGYTVTYDAENNRIKVKLKVPVKRSDTSPWNATFTVKDRDTEAVIKDAEISCDYEDEFPYENGHKSDANGIVEADMSAGEHKLTISAAGYKSKSETVTIKPSNTDNGITLYLEPTRYTFKVPTVKLKDTETVVADAKVTVTKISKNKTYAWNDKSDSIEVDAASELDLPDGDFELRSSTYGYTTDDVIYIRVNRNAENEDERVTYYTDSKLSAKTTAEAGSVLHVVKMTEPMYYLEIDKSETDDFTYTATVTLSNIKATFGTFGIRYDPEMFTLNPDNGGVKLGSNIYSDWHPTVEEYYGYDKDDNLKWKNENGYYTFVWSAGNKSNAVLDTEPKGGATVEKEIVTFTFKLNGDDANLADAITVDTFGIEPWDETEAAKEYAKETAENDPEEDPLFWEHWRYVDKDNNKHTLTKGRIEESKSVVNGVETNGFFQASVNGSLGDTNPYSCYDVMTVLHYGFPIKNSIIKFHVTDADTDDNLKDVRLRLFDMGEKLFDSKYTNLAGSATFSVDTSGSTVTDFSYDAQVNGYWPLPFSGLLKDRPSVAAETGKATEVEVKLQKKIYHVPQIKAGETQTLALVADADLGGEKYAYNGQDFYFRIKGAKGFRITEYPTKAFVTIGDSVTDLELTHDENGLFKLDGEYLYQEPLGSDMFGADGYEDFNAQPDAEGFRSYNIVVTFDKFEVKELEYIVEGMTNEYGTVKYDPDKPENGGRTADTDTDTYVKVITQATQYSDPEKTIKTADPNHLTGTFTFTANDDYMVEKVYINGLLIDTYNGETQFTYSFGTVDMDSSIIVMFWDGVNPSTDSVMTLVVGEYGSVDISSPVEEKDVSFTRRVYLNPEENLVFDTTPINQDYRLCKVEKASDGSPRAEIASGADGKYTVAPNKGESVTVYVTFRHKDAEITPNVFVKAYVYDGKGVINPAGILIYAMNDSPELVLTADTKQAWRAKGVMISPYEDLDDVSEWDFDTLENTNTYRYDSIKSDMAFGAIFVEKSYKLQGYVDLSQGSNVTTAAPKTGAIVTFMRVEDGEEKAKQTPVRTTTTAARTGAVFTVDLPAGDWNVYITKPGYLMYKITEFTFDPNQGDDITYKFGQKDVNTVQQTVVPYIGSAKNGSRITLGDASVIKSGWRDHVNETVRAMADVDNDDKVSVKDMTYVMKNFNQRIVTQKYADFVESGSGTPKVTED